MKKYWKIFFAILTLAICFALMSCGGEDDGTEDVFYASAGDAVPPSELTLPTVFADGMVFQRQKTVNVFGYYGTDGAKVRATLGDDSAEATVKNGRFNVALPPREVEKGLTLTVELVDVADSAITYENVMVGEVWVISGQSNADHEAYKLEDVAEYAAGAVNFDNLYLYTTPNTHCKKPDLIGQGSWKRLERSDLLNHTRVSAQMYVTATVLAAELGNDIPIAVMNLAKTSSRLITWMDEQTLGEYDRDAYNRFRAYDDFYDKNGRYPGSLQESSYFISGTTNKPYASLGTICYNTYLAHMEGYSVRGIVWHQGEGDVGDPNGYARNFDGLLVTMRRVFGNDDELPLFQTQLSSYADSHPNYTAPFKAAQFDIAAEQDNVYLISAVDGGTPMNTVDLKNGLVHSSRKSPIGLRCANAILKIIYGITHGDYVNAPVPLSVKGSGSGLVITFDSELRMTYGTKVDGFQLCYNGVWYDAEATVDGCTVTVFSDDAPSPNAVRYGFGNYKLEMQDGTVHEMVGYENKTTYTLIKLADGTTLEMYPDDGSRIRLMVPGNLTNESGEPLPVFLLYKEG